MYGDTTFMSQEEHQNSSELQKSLFQKKLQSELQPYDFF